MEAKRAALESILDKPNPGKPNNERPDNAAPTLQNDSAQPAGTRQVEGESLQSPASCGRKRDRKVAKPLNQIGSPPWTRFELLQALSAL
jgi:hypothetical protein